MKALLKKAYKALPYKQQIYSGLKQVWTPNEEIYKHLHFKGKFRVPVDGSYSFWINHYGFQIENEIFWAGLENGWEKESFKLWISLCKEAEYIFDVGANTGIYSLIAHAVNPNAKVWAFEPVERVFKKLEENISLNQFPTVCVNKALSDSDGTAIIYDSGGEHVLSVTVNQNLTPSREVEEVSIPITRLDTYIRQNPIPRIDLMKIDVECHEPEVLKGMGDLLSQHQPIMLIEILNNEIAQAVEEIVHNFQYLYFNINEKGGIRKVEKLEKSDYYNYLFCKEETAKRLGFLS